MDLLSAHLDRKSAKHSKIFPIFLFPLFSLFWALFRALFWALFSLWGGVGWGGLRPDKCAPLVAGASRCGFRFMWNSEDAP